MCFTLNNYTNEEYEDLWNEDTNYCVLGKEVGNQGTPHIQGYIEFKNPRNISSIKKKFPRIHLEEREGTSKDASNYCKKGEQQKDEWKAEKEKGKNWGLNAKFEEKGELSNQGKRNDLDRATNMIVNNQPLRQVAMTYPKEYVKFHKGLLSLHNILKPPRTTRPKCYWFHGVTGTGKTYKAKNLGASYYIKSSTKWWDGYDQQEVVIIDDFRKDNFPFDEILRWLDENECIVEVKGSTIQLNSPIMVITCDVAPYIYWQGNDLDQLMRRLTGGVEYFRDPWNRSFGTEVTER